MKKTRFVHFLILAAVLGFVFFAFWPALFNGFILWDDNLYVVENEMIRSLSWASLKTLFTTDVSLNYTPLTSLSFALEYHFFNDNPFFYHLDNVFLHLLVTALVFIFAWRLSLSGIVAAVAALFFGLHPMHVESVAWITERKDVLYGSFYLLALIFYWDYLAGKRKFFYAASLACGFLSVLAKPMALSLPFVLFLLDWFYGRKLERKIFFEKIPFGLAIFSIAWLTYAMNSRAVGFVFPESILIWIWTALFYIRKFLFPWDFLPLYQLPSPIQITHPEFAFSVIGVLFIGVVLFYFRKNRWLIFAFLFYFVSIFFLLRFDDRVDLCIVADRFMYLPSIGICILAGIYFKKLWNWGRHKNFNFQMIAISAMAGCFLFLGFSTYRQSQIWGDEISFWNSVLKHYPQAALAYNQRALAYKAKGDLKEALRDYSQAIALFPDYDFALTNRGTVYKEMGKYESAWADHSRAIAVNPGFSEAYFNRGNVSFAVGDFKGALADYDKAIQTVSISARRKSTPYQAEVYSRRGSAHFFAKHYDNALWDFNQALKIDSNNIVALDNRAIIFSLRGEKEKALQDFARSLILVPQNPINYVNRAQLLNQVGDRAGALRDIAAALALSPDNKRALALKVILEK